MPSFAALYRLKKIKHHVFFERLTRCGKFFFSFSQIAVILDALKLGMSVRVRQKQSDLNF